MEMREKYFKMKLFYDEELKKYALTIDLVCSREKKNWAFFLNRTFKNLDLNVQTNTVDTVLRNNVYFFK